MFLIWIGCVTDFEKMLIFLLQQLNFIVKAKQSVYLLTVQIFILSIPIVPTLLNVIFIAQFMIQALSETSSREDEGFEAQKISIEKKGQTRTLLRLNTDEGNEIIDDLRPKDLLPRSTYKELQLRSYPQCIDNTRSFDEPQKLVPLSQDEMPPKNKKYLSLQQKYKKSHYPLKYHKFPLDDSNYLHSYINLEKIVDCSASNFKTFSNDQQTQSLFDSRFQSGNLLYAYLVDLNQYDIVLQNDTNTKGYNQWFYFSYNFKDALEVGFNVVSMIKKKTLFEKGVKPCFFVQEGEKRWRQIVSDVKYYKNGVQRENGQPYYTLAFKYKPENACKVYFSLNLPYTYTKMVNLVKELQSFNRADFSVQRHTLGYSISNNEIPYLTIKSNIHKPEKQILFFARQHPGETISSYIMQSLLRALFQKFRLLQKFQVICVPMLNVDGVIYGNFRTNLAGYDINRQWKDTDKWMNPEVYALKKLIRKQSRLLFVLDLHGHSKKFNSFIYACKQQSKFQQKLFPFLMSRNSLFKIQSCTYGLSKQKMSTARAFIKGLGINHIYTFQTSFYGYGSQGDYHRFQHKHFDSLGSTIISALQQLYFSKSQQLQKYQEEINQIIEVQQKLFGNGSNASGSDSNPDQDVLSDNQRQVHVIPQKIIEQKNIKQSEKSIKKLKKHIKNVKTGEKDKQKRSESVYNSNKQLNSYQKEKYQIKRNFQYATSRSVNRPIKTVTNKTIQSESFRSSTKVMKQSAQEQTDRLQRIINKKKPREVKQFTSTKKTEQQTQQKYTDDKKTLSSLFLSTIRRNSIKPKRPHRSLINERLSSLTKQQSQMIASYNQKHTSNLKQPLNSLMVIETKYNLKDINKLDRIVEERIRQKMTQSALTNIPKLRRSQYNTGVAMSEQSNLLQRSCLSNTLLMDQQKGELRESVSRVSRKTRNHRNKKELIFLSELMRPKVEYGRGYQIEVIGSNSQSKSKSSKYKRSMYFNQYV